MKILSCMVAAAVLITASATTAPAGSRLTSAEERELEALLDKIHGPWPAGIERRGYHNAPAREPVPPGCYEKSVREVRGRTHVRVICPKG